MRRLRHPIIVFVVSVLAVIGAGVGVLAGIVPPAHTMPAVSQHPPDSSSIAWARQLRRTQAHWPHHRPGSEHHQSSQRDRR